MNKGIIFALAACFLGGLIFVIPLFMEGYSAFEIGFGCYFCYGLIAILHSLQNLKKILQTSSRIILQALLFSLISIFVYYTSVFQALRYTNPAICALILGISPITIAWYGNWKVKEGNYKSLIFPSILIFIGLVLINAPKFFLSESLSEYTLGLIFSFIGLASWSWYVVANSQFVKNNPKISSVEWSSLVGLATFFWVSAALGVILILFKDQVDWSKYSLHSSRLIVYVIGCIALGFLCTWLYAFLWNKASSNLPIALTGQLNLFETLFGLIFVYALEQDLPSVMEFCGIVLMLIAIIMAIRATAHPKESYGIIEVIPSENY